MRGAIAALDLVVAILFLVRGAALAHGPARDVVAAIPSIVIGALAVKLAPERWPIGCELAFAIGAALAVGSLATLGRSFAILPARRAIVIRGPYRLVRHPAYASELVMASAAGAASQWWIGGAALVAITVSLVPRVLAEERVLAEDPAWREYASRVRYRLLPGIF